MYNYFLGTLVLIMTVNFTVADDEINIRIALDYSLSKTDLLQQLQKRLNGVDEELLNQWDHEGRFDSRVIDGDIKYFSSSVSNLLFRYPDVKAMRKTLYSQAWGSFVAQTVNEYFKGTGYHKLVPQRFHNRMTLTVDANAVESGDTIRCWLPLPQHNAFQPQVNLHHTTPEASYVSNETVEHRSVYTEQIQEHDAPTKFSIEYTYTSKPRLNTINPDRVSKSIPESVSVWTKEQPPHVMFDENMAAAVNKIIGKEHNPYLKARRIYLWMVEHFNYSYAREYSTIPNISTYCFEKRYGDCGQLALTFITMCRIAGVPARWETGWMMYPDLKNLHDWCVIYISPYGWIPVDVNMGIEAQHQWRFLADSDRKNIIEFYFGNMDPYRMAMNSNHGADFDPPKTYLRSDTVDFQRGEVESSTGNIYYDQFDYHLEIISNTNKG